MSARELITEHLDLWTGAVTKKSSSGRGSNGKVELTGVKKLRELILELAVRGLLTDQLTTDKSAGNLLQKIIPEVEQLIKAGRFKVPKEKKPNSELDAPFTIPKTWIWCSLDQIAVVARGGSPRPIKSFITTDSSGLNWIKIGDATKGSRLITKAAEKIIPEGLHKTRMVYPGDLILSNSMSFGQPYILDIEGCIHDGWLLLRTPEGLVDKVFLYYLLLSPYAMNAFTDSAAGAVVQNLNADKVRLLRVPLPPLEEQHRIVQKVDELMALCDRLEQQTSDQLEAHETLVDTLLGTLTQSQNATELADNWARLAAHFDTLFTTEQSIDKLKQTILQLAVMGRLVEQDAGDQPATELLKRIEAEKIRLTQRTKTRTAKALPSIEESERPFSLPSGWTLSRLDDITDIQGGIAKGKKMSGKQTRTLPYLRVANVQRSSLNLSEVKEIEIAEKEVERYLVQQRDLLITEGGDWDKVGRTAIWDGRIKPMAHQNHVFRARLVLDEQNERWLERYLNSQFARDYFASSSKQTTNLASINKTQLRSCTIPLPPLKEQDRIVQKVDELMALCDQLKERLNQASETRGQLADTIVEATLG